MAFSDPQKILEQFGLHEGQVVADLGAGSGFYSLTAARMVGGAGRVYSVDVQEDLLSKIKNTARQGRLLNVEVVHGDMEKQGGTRLREQCADAAIASNVLFQIEQKDDFMDEVKRILKPSGRLLLVDWTDSFDGMGPQAEQVINQVDAKALAEKHGFSYVTALDAGDNHYGLVFRKN